MGQAPGIMEIQTLQEGGFSEDEIVAYRDETAKGLYDAGFSDKEVNDYFGTTEPDMSPVKQHFEQRLAAAEAPAGNTGSGVPTEGQATPVTTGQPQAPEQAKTFTQALEAGWDISVTGLIAQQKSPDMVLQENPEMFMRIAMSLGNLAGDFVPMVLGTVGGLAAGAAVGSAVPVVGTAVGGVLGAGAGGNALPEAMRQILMQQYEKGDVQSFSDFWERASKTFIETSKAGIVGAATAGVGGKIAGVVGKTAAPALAKTATQLMSEVATMTTVGSALNGQIPEPQDFLDGAALVVGLHGAVKVAPKIRNLYAKTGLDPATILEKSDGNPKLKQELASDNNPVPPSAFDNPIEATKPPEVFSTVEPLAEPKSSLDSGKMEIKHPITASDPEIAGAMAEDAKAMSREDFVNKYKTAPFKMDPYSLVLDGSEKPSTDNLYHGTGSPLQILESGQIKTNVSKGDTLQQNIVSTSSYQPAAAGFGVTFEIDKAKLKDTRDASNQVMGEGTTSNLEVRVGHDIPLDAVKSMRIELGSKETLDSVVQYVGEKGVTARQLKKIAESKGLRVDVVKSGTDAGSFYDNAKAASPPNAVDTILGNVGTKEKAPRKMPTFDQMYTDMVDKLDPVNVITKELEAIRNEPLPADKNPHILTRVANDAKAKAKHFFEKGTIDYDTLEVNGPSFRSILEGVESRETLEAFLISKRALEKHAQGFKTGFDIEAAKKVVAEHGAKYEKAAQDVTGFLNKSLEYAQKSGLLSKESLAKMQEANKDYVPFKRITETVEGGSKAGGKAGSLKAFTGSDKSIQSPIMSSVENTIELLQAAENNRALKAMAVAGMDPVNNEGVVRRVKTPMKEVKVTAAEFAKALKEQGLPEDIEFSPEAFEIFRKNEKQLRPNEFAVMEDGKKVVYETDPDLARALNTLGGDGTSMNMGMRMLRGITVVKKLAITATPDFAVRNFIRDVVSGNVFTKAGGISLIDVGSAMVDLVKKNDTYYNWLKSGGANGAFMEMNEHYIAKDIFKLQKETGFMNSVVNVAKTGFDYARMGAELSEQSLRLAEFKKVSQGKTDPASLIKGGFAAREVTLDFQRVGAKMSALNSITAFMNVGIQGLDKTARAFKENPTGTLGKAAMFITAPSMLLWWANKDDKRLDEIPRWQKDLSWIIPTDDWKPADENEAAGLPDYMVRPSDKGGFEVNRGKLYKIPKPQELGIIFGSLPERMMDAFFKDNPDAFKDFDETMVGLVTPNFVPDAVAPAVEQYFNKSFFTGSDIIPHSMKDIMPQYQYVEYTSTTAKTLGKVLSGMGIDSGFASPMVLDNYARSWGGALGNYAVQLLDRGLENSGIAEKKVRPSHDWVSADTPFIKSFVVRFPQANSQSVKDFSETFKANKVVQNTLNFLKGRHEFESFEEEAMDPENQSKLIKLDGIHKGLQEQNRFIQEVMADDDMTPDEKRQMIDMSYMQMTEVAGQANAMLKDILKEVKEAKEAKENKEK